MMVEKENLVPLLLLLQTDRSLNIQLCLSAGLLPDDCPSFCFCCREVVGVGGLVVGRDSRRETKSGAEIIGRRRRGERGRERGKGCQDLLKKEWSSKRERERELSLIHI